MNVMKLVNSAQTNILQTCTKFKFSHFKNINVDNLKLVLEDGRRVQLRDNYKDQVNKLLNDSDSVDRSWLIVSIDMIGFITTNGVFFPLIVEDESSSQNSANIERSTMRLSNERTITAVPDISDNFTGIETSSTNEAAPNVSHDSEIRTERMHVVLDQSGSMNNMNEAAYAGARELINDMPEDSTISFTTFSSSVHLGESTSKEAALQTLQCKVANGTTSLYDAIYRVIDSERSIQASIKTIVIVTDGMDTSSTKSQEEARVKVTEFQNDSHRVLFLGSNQNACLTAQAIGIPIARAMTYGTNTENMRDMFRAVSSNNQRFRSLGQDTFLESERSVSIRS